MDKPKPGFVLPPILRVTWVSNHARDVWGDKFAEFSKAWHEIEWRSVAHGVRPCALLFLSLEELADLASQLREFKLKAVPLQACLQTRDREKVLRYHVAVGTVKVVRAFRKAWISGASDVVGQLLGYPKCCRSFFRETFDGKGLVDHTWQMGIRSAGVNPDVESIHVDGFAELNPFWIGEGVQMVPHFPCRFDCPESKSFAKKLMSVGNKAGHAAIVETGLEILRWPVEWSCLHGIAEIKTPILKILRRTDATATKRAIHFLGDSYPKEGARPYYQAARPLISPPPSH
jgi:hypothetical protein